MDGMRAPPLVLDRGLWRGVLNLVILEYAPGTRAYGVQIRCETYGAFEEMIYSIAGHGDGSGRYDGGVYIKEAVSSRLLGTYVEVHPVNLKRNMRHFSFVGYDFCYETLGIEVPKIHAFPSWEAAYSWVPNRDTDAV
jgi:hypothetical protein